MQGQALTSSLDPMVAQRPSIVTGTGRPHHPEHKSDVQSALADSTSMQQQRSQQLSPGNGCLVYSLKKKCASIGIDDWVWEGVFEQRFTNL